MTKGKLFLCGGGDEKQTFELDKIFFENVNKILYIPIAWENDDFERCLKWFKNMCSQHKSPEITMLTDFKEKIELENFDAVYIGGGNTFKLLKQMKESDFDKKLIEFYNAEGIIYGGSAGALIQGRNIETALLCKDADVNNVGLKDLSGLNLIKNLDIQAHYEPDQIEEHQEHIKKTKANILGIPEESALFVNNEKYEVIGTKPISLIKENKFKDYQINENIQI